MKLTTALLALTLASPATAATTFDVVNFAGPSNTGARYGDFCIVQEWQQHVFACDDVSLTINDDGTARMTGALTQIRGTRSSGWAIDYSWQHLFAAGPDAWLDTTGTGRGQITSATYSYSLGAEAMGGIFGVIAGDWHRIPAHMRTEANRWGIHNWTGPDDRQRAPNDITATLTPAAIPLPAGWALILGALAGLGLYRRKVA